ncbi:MAG: thioredoxin family protein [Victivallaceae bacterium]
MKKLCALLLFCFVSVTAFAAGDNWLTNLDDAKKIAEKENKIILMDFSGSDWCGWCMKLEKEVFSQQIFKDYAKDNLVLLLVDFPQEKELDPATKTANDILFQKYKVEGFPTVILLDSKGDVIGQTGYRAGGAEAYVTYLKELIAKGKK